MKLRKWFLLTGEKWRSATLSLDGLLDYDESDKDEGTFELSLFAEAFQDMLMRDYGLQIYEAMQAFRYCCPSQSLPIWYTVCAVSHRSEKSQTGKFKLRWHK